MWISGIDCEKHGACVGEEFASAAPIIQNISNDSFFHSLIQPDQVIELGAAPGYSGEIAFRFLFNFLIAEGETELGLLILERSRGEVLFMPAAAIFLIDWLSVLGSLDDPRSEISASAESVDLAAFHSWFGRENSRQIVIYGVSQLGLAKSRLETIRVC